MTIYKKIEINGIAANDAISVSITISSSVSNAFSTCEIIYPNENGIHNNDLVIGDEVVIYSDKNINPPTTKLFTGVIRNIQKNSSSTVQQEIRVIAQDYASQLKDSAVEPEVYNNAEISFIVLDLMAKYAPATISTSGVQTSGRTLDRIVFVGQNLFDVLIQLSELAGFIMYVNEEKILHFEEKGSVSSGLTFDSTNVLESAYQQTVDQEVFNKVWVYGDLTFTGVRQEFNVTGGSTYTLSYNPHNTRLERNGIVYLGGADTFVGELPSGTQYIVRYYDKTIEFLSGTNIGNWIPAAGSFLVDYQRQKQIIKYSEEPDSIAAYWPIGTKIVDKGIKDPSHAALIAKNYIKEHGFPRTNFRISLNGVSKLQAGQTVIVNLQNKGILNATYEIIETSYDFTPESIQSENVVSVSLNKKIGTITDTIKNIILDIRKLQAGDIQTDIISRLSVDSGKLVNTEKNWIVYNNQIGQSFVLGHLQNGVMGDILAGSGILISGATFTTETGSYMHGTSAIKMTTLGDGIFTNISSQVNFNSGQPFTITAWLNSTNTGSPGYIVAKNPDGNNRAYALFVNSGINFFVANGATNNTQSLGSFSQDAWHHIVCAYNPTQANFYLDGIALGSKTMGATGDWTNTNGISIGRRAINTNVFYGILDDVRIYNRTLSDSEIGSIYSGFTITSGLRLWASFEERTGSVTYPYVAGSIQPLLGDHRKIIIDRSGGTW